MSGQTMQEMDRPARIDAIARVAHEANRAWCVAHGDESQVPWDEAPDWQKDSARNGVEAAARGLSPEELHVNWMDEKYKDGWSYGPVKSPEHKTHPCLVEYDELPAHQRTKDGLFHATVNALVPVLLTGRFA